MQVRRRQSVLQLKLTMVPFFYRVTLARPAGAVFSQPIAMGNLRLQKAPIFSMSVTERDMANRKRFFRIYSNVMFMIATAEGCPLL